VPTLITTMALILGRRPWSESSQIVTMMTPDQGRLNAVARGARKLTSEMGPALEPITESQVILSQSPRSDMANVRSAEIVEHFAALRHSLVRVTVASAACEFAARALPEGEANPSAYDHVRTALAGIAATADRDAVNWLWRGLMDLAGDLGYAMQFDRCVQCGASDLPHPAFSVADGGPVCERCSAATMRPWLPETQAALIRLAAASAGAVGADRITKRVNRDIRGLVEEYFRYHIPGFDHLRSLDVLTSLSAAGAASGPGPDESAGVE